MLSIGIGLVVLGALLQFSLPVPLAPSRDALLKQRVDAIFAPAIRAVSGLPVARLSPDDYKNLEPAQEVSGTIIGLILDSLNRTGQLPERLIRIDADPSAFWQRPWPYFHAISTGNGDLRLVGIIVNLGSTEQPKLQRWLGVFRRNNGRWQYASLAGDTFYSPAPSANIRDIALDLAPLLPPEN
jgi:hypothetical protein